MPTIDDVQPHCQLCGVGGGVRGAPALPPDFAKCGGSRRVVEAPPRRRVGNHNGREICKCMFHAHWAHPRIVQKLRNSR